MADLFTGNELKVRPGVHQRTVPSGNDAAANTSARDGYCAVAIKATWGPLGKVTTHTKDRTVKLMYGSDAYSDTSTVECALAMMGGGATTLHIYRLGEGGSKGEYEIRDGASSIAKITAKYEGAKELKVSVMPRLGDSSRKTLTVYDGVTEVETLTFMADPVDEITNLVKAAARSAYIDVEKVAEGVVPTILSSEGVLSGGVDPSVSNESYSKAWEALDRYFYNTTALDVDDDENLTLSNMLALHLNQARTIGKQSMAVVAEKTGVPFADRLANAKSFDDEKIIYLGNGYKNAEGKLMEGAPAACAVAGLIAATPSSEGIVHKKMPGAVGLLEELSDQQYIDAVEGGMLLLSVGTEGEIWFDSGVNTLTTVTEEKDKGWKKIRRTKTRFEAMERIDRVVSRKTGRINGDADGFADVIQSGQGILDDMHQEKKIHIGSRFVLDPEFEPTADSAWFSIDMVDIDSLEHIYLSYMFRYQNT